MTRSAMGSNDRHGSFLMKPIFAASHRWAMAKGEERLQGELNRGASARGGRTEAGAG